MVWRNCVASVTLASEIAIRWPRRDRASDGTIGDAAHQSRSSDHNPWVKDRNGVGVVRARDIDEDLDGNQSNGVGDANVLFQHLLKLAKAGDPRINGGGYLIYESKIYSDKQNWAPRKYTGTSNPHDKHMHISFSLNASGYDSDKPWGLLTPEKPKPKPFQLGSRGEGVAMVADMGNILASAGMTLNRYNRPSRVQIKVPKDKVGRATFLYNNQVRERVAEFQRFALVMWKLGGRQGKEPVVNGIFDGSTANMFSFWVPVALQKR